MEILPIIIFLVSGIGAGIMTGLIGASAVTFMAGILIILLNFNPYTAIGISLLTDVFASLTSAYIYKKSSNLDIQRGLIIGVFAIVFAFLGGLISRAIPDLALGDGIGIVTLITGLAFLRNPLQRKDTMIFKYLRKKKTFSSILMGIVLGLFCGIFGVGGGITILVALVFVLKYPIKKAVGTSVFIMIFIALSGGIAHFIYQPIPIVEIAIASIGGIMGAIIASKYANSISEEKMFKISGMILIIISLIVIFKKFFTLAGFSILGI